MEEYKKEVERLELEIQGLRTAVHELMHMIEQARIKAEQNHKISEYWQSQASRI